MMLMHTITITVHLDDDGRPHVGVDHNDDLNVLEMVGYLEAAKLEAYLSNRPNG